MAGERSEEFRSLEDLHTLLVNNPAQLTIAQRVIILSHRNHRLKKGYRCLVCQKQKIGWITRARLETINKLQRRTTPARHAWQHILPDGHPERKTDRSDAHDDECPPNHR